MMYVVVLNGRGVPLGDTWEKVVLVALRSRDPLEVQWTMLVFQTLC